MEIVYFVIGMVVLLSIACLIYAVLSLKKKMAQFEKRQKQLEHQHNVLKGGLFEVEEYGVTEYREVIEMWEKVNDMYKRLKKELGSNEEAD